MLVLNTFKGSYRQFYCYVVIYMLICRNGPVWLAGLFKQGVMGYGGYCNVVVQADCLAGYRCGMDNAGRLMDMADNADSIWQLYRCRIVV